MANRLNFRVKATSTTEGTGTLTLVAASSAFRAFSTLGASAKCRYAILGTSYFEVGIGTWTTAGPNTLSRDTVLRSSAADAAVSLPTGTHDVIIWSEGERPVDVLTGSPTLTLADLFSTQLYTGTGGTLALPAIANCPPGIAFWVIHIGTGNLTIDPNSSEQINGASTLVLPAGSAAYVTNRDAATAQWVAAVSLTAPPASLAAANTFAAAQIIRAAATALFNVESTDAGAAEGPIADFYRDSASPAASDVLAALYFSGKSSTAVKRQFAKITATILDATNASEDATLALQTIVAGTLAARATFGQGLVMAGATGGDPGAGKINATDYLVNGASILGASIKTEANWNQSGTLAIRRSTNVSTIGDNGVGDATINRTSALASADPSFGTCANQIVSGTHSGTAPNLRGTGTTDMTTSSIRVQMGNSATGGLGDQTVATYLEVGA